MNHSHLITGEGMPLSKQNVGMPPAPLLTTCDFTTESAEA